MCHNSTSVTSPLGAAVVAALSAAAVVVVSSLDD